MQGHVYLPYAGSVIFAFNCYETTQNYAKIKGLLRGAVCGDEHQSVHTKRSRTSSVCFAQAQTVATRKSQAALATAGWQ